MRVSCLAAVATAVLGLAGSALAARAADDACYQKAQTQAQLNACASAALKREDDQLNQLYRQIMDRLGADQKARDLLTHAERDWLRFRGSACSFTAMRVADGSIYPMMMNDCMAGLTRTRNIELQDHLACYKGGEQAAAQCAVPGPAMK
ncbi:lysozyme inhibitor LprI family protein [Comamonas badia]|uniref:lysozyme inhibitor LprI family protein n=1 Tax=Comamonas badia TaxID=265291 RepID=UPI000466EC60|nr:lysozyme inhibitor LprI family protein [Comamonas badia]